MILENDANAAAYGEYCLAGKPSQGLIYLGLGTGVGSGLIINGKPYTGEHGVAMEVGHMIVELNGRPCGCGNKVCMEQYASANGIALTYFNATKQLMTAHEIANLAKNGDKFAQQSYDLAASVLAQTLANITKVIDVENVVIGGGMAAAWPLMHETFVARFNADLIPALRGDIKVKISTADDTAGMLGAAMLTSATIT